jgi:hypothetical protein
MWWVGIGAACIVAGWASFSDWGLGQFTGYVRIGGIVVGLGGMILIKVGWGELFPFKCGCGAENSLVETSRHVRNRRSFTNSSGKTSTTEEWQIDGYCSHCRNVLQKIEHVTVSNN